MVKRCNRMYHQLLKRVDSDLYYHLCNINYEPELQMMRWLRCILCREYDVVVTLQLWDYIFTRINPTYIDESKFSQMYFEDDYLSSGKDPLISLDYLIIGMILYIRDDVYGKSEEQCLMAFFSFPKIENSLKIISIAERIEKTVNNKIDSDKFVSIPSAFSKVKTTED